MRSLSFSKGHGTGNDFIVIPDTAGEWNPTPDQIRWLCDRRQGIGADGVLRVVLTRNLGDLSLCREATYFMDYRNADGTTAEMCGNGVRVFARYLVDHELESGSEFVVGSRAGCVPIRMGEGDQITATLHGPVTPRGTSLTVSLGERSWPAIGVMAPNPHVVVLGVDVSSLGSSVLTPSIEPADAFPDGANVEFVERLGPGRIRMRVVERGVGETMSCGTGACAASWASAQTEASECRSWSVEVPGGLLRVDFPPDGSLELTGPAVLVAEGRVALP